MITSAIRTVGNVPTLVINDEAVVPMSYITYFNDRGCYDDFARAGYRIYSIAYNFAGQPLNPIVAPKPFTRGIFDDPEHDDFAEFDADVMRIIKACPEARIFPRINISMPLHWEKAHPEECNDEGLGGRQAHYCFSSDLWRKDDAEYLRRFIEHIHNSSYSDNIIGYQLAAGSTDEWVGLDEKGSIGETARKKCRERYGENASEEQFYRFLSEIAAESIIYFAGVVKKLTGNKQIVGAFYGYTFGVPRRESCHHALRKILAAPEVDFICSPGDYGARLKPEFGWSALLPLDSLKLHNKLYFFEFDTRTYLTRHMNECRPGTCKEGDYTHPVWSGLERKYTLGQLRMNFAQQIACGCASWWFDMWGGWYADDELMAELEAFHKHAAKFLTDSDRSSIAEVAVFIDENTYAKDPDSKVNGWQVNTNRRQLTQSAAPVALCEMGDFYRMVDRLKMVIFFSDTPTPDLADAVSYCEKHHIPFMLAEPDKPLPDAGKMQEIFRNAGIHVWCDREYAVYANKNMVALHAAEDGECTVILPEKRLVTPLFPAGESFEAERFTLELKLGDTVVYRLD